MIARHVITFHSNQKESWEACHEAVQQATNLHPKTRVLDVRLSWGQHDAYWVGWEVVVELTT